MHAVRLLVAPTPMEKDIPASVEYKGRASCKVSGKVPSPFSTDRRGQRVSCLLSFPELLFTRCSYVVISKRITLRGGV
jgi:hypothetical protein